MNLDATTAQLTSSILLAAITTHLMLTTVLQYDTRAGRIISVAYICVTGTGVLTASLPGGTQVQPWRLLSFSRQARSTGM